MIDFKALCTINSAESFYNTYKLLESEIKKNSEQNQYVIPAIVNSMFAIELYLKSILNYYSVKFSKKGKDGHDLYILFTKIPNKIQRSIKSEFKKEMQISVIPYQYDNLVDYLQGEYNSFQMWRYHFEERKNNRYIFPQTDTDAILKILCKECNIIKRKIIKQIKKNESDVND